MLDKRKLIIYPPLNLEHSTMPNRTNLYPLEPIGIGTAYCESLVSYIIRLAYEHRVSLKTLIKEISHKTPNIIYPVVMTNNNDLSHFVFELEKRTMQSNLHCLTMLNWSKIFRFFQLYKKNLSWCPLCYEEWKKQHQTLYFPLIWLMFDVKICPIHNCILLEQCLHCGYFLKSVVHKYKIGYCPQCKKWLGQCDNTINKTLENDSFTHPLTQQYIIDNIIDLIYANYFSNYCVLSDRIRWVISQSALHTKIRFSGYLGVNNKFRQNFLKEINLPFEQYRAYYQFKYTNSRSSLITLLKLTHYCKISLIDLFFQDFETLTLAIENNIELPEWDALSNDERDYLSSYTYYLNRAKIEKNINLN